MGTNLSRRELEVARLVGEGLTNREIATRLFISERTVDGHLEHIREKLGVSNRAQVTAWIVRQDAAVVPAAEPPPTPRRWTMAHPRVWMAGALVLALLAVGAGLLRLTEPSPPIIETIAGSRCVVQHYPGGCFGGDSFLAINAGLARPSALAIDGHGRLYIADYNNYRIRMVDTKGVITTVAGDPRKPRLTENAYATLVDIGNASSIAVDNQGELLVLTVVTDDLELWRVDGAGFFHQMASLGHTNAGQSGLINMPVGGLAVAQDGTIFIADRDGNRVLRLPPGGTLQKFAGTGEFGFGGDGLAASDAKLAWPIGLALDRLGDVFIADSGNNRIRKVNAKERITTVAGSDAIYGDSGDGGPATEARLSFPFGLAVAPDGSLVIADTGNHRLRRVAGGEINPLAGTGRSGFAGDTGPAGDAELSGPEAIVFDFRGDLFIADTENQRVREIPRLIPA